MFHQWVAAPCTLALAAGAQAQEPSPVEPDFGSTMGADTLDGHASVALAVHAGHTILGGREVGGQIVLQLPFGRILSRGPAPRTATEHIAEPRGQRPAVAPAPHPRLRRHIAVKPSLARACVRAAWRAHGLSGFDMVDRMRARARTSALLPEAKFRITRDWDQSYRLTPTTDDPYRLQESNGGGRTLEGRLTWKLDRLLFVDEELSMERLRVQRIQARSRLAGDVLTALFDWQRARIALANDGLEEDAQLEAMVREAEAAATLDVLTGGWFSAWLEKGAS